jgi:hypothetical protein
VETMLSLRGHFLVYVRCDGFCCGDVCERIHSRCCPRNCGCVGACMLRERLRKGLHDASRKRLREAPREGLREARRKGLQEARCKGLRKASREGLQKEPRNGLPEEL